MTDNALMPTADAPLAVAQRGANDLLAMAIQGKADIGTIERLVALFRDNQAREAKMAFDEAVARFQAHCPTIVKSKAVYDKGGKERYRYAPLADILRQIQPVMEECGLSHREDARIEHLPEGATMITAVCVVTHAAGHSEASTFAVPVDPEAYMTAPQKFASALTFAKRYAFTNALGIMTADEDDDAQSAHTRADLQRQVDARFGGEPAPPAPPQTGKPACPKCGKAEFVYESKKEGGWFCWKNAAKNKNGCGHKWGGTDAAPPPADEKPHKQTFTETLKARRQKYRDAVEARGLLAALQVASRDDVEHKPIDFATASHDDLEWVKKWVAAFDEKDDAEKARWQNPDTWA